MLPNYRSSSPSTISTEPTMAIKSATMQPREISCSTDKLEKHGERPLHRKGISDLPVARKK